MPSNAEEKVLSYGDVLLRRQDVHLLTGPYWLNDQIVTFYFEYLWKEQLHNSDKILFVGGALTYLLSQLAGDISGIVEPLQLSSKELVFFAVNNNPDASTPQGGSHWTLLLYSSKAKEFSHYDSASNLGSTNDLASQQIAKAVSPYLGQPKGRVVRVSAAKTPQQTNCNDCGLYVLACAKLIAAEWQASLSTSSQPIMQTLYSQVTPAAIKTLRGELLQIIIDLAGVAVD